MTRKEAEAAAQRRADTFGVRVYVKLDRIHLLNTGKADVFSITTEYAGLTTPSYQDPQRPKK